METLQSNPEHPLSWEALLRVIVVIFSAFLLWRLQDVVIIILMSLILASAVQPLVKKLSQKLPLTLSASLIIFMLFLPLAIVLIGLVPGFYKEVPNILRTIDTTLQSPYFPDAVRTIDLEQYSQDIGNYLIRSTSTITNSIASFFTIIFLTLYFLIDGEQLYKMVIELFPTKYKRRLKKLITHLNTINGNYIRGNITISLICAFLISIGLLILKVPYAISLGVFAGIVDLLPLVGAVIGLIPAAILGFSISPLTGLLVIVLFLVYQQFENNIVAPNIYNKVLDLSPTLSFIAVIIGSTLLGIIGAFIALPFAASLTTVLKFMYDVQQENAKELEEKNMV